MATSRRNKKAEIQQTAAHLFRNSSFSATSVDTLANALSLNKGTLYHYYDSKTDILFDVVLRALETLHQGLLRIPSSAPAEDQLRAIIELCVAQVMEFPDETAVYFQEMPWLRTSLNADQTATVNEYESRFTQAVERALTLGEKSGAFRKVNHVFIRYSIVGILRNLPTWFHADGELSPKQITAHFSSLILVGVTAERRA